MNVKVSHFFCAAALLLMAGGVAQAGDLDDGISKYSDDSISANDNLGDPDRNVKFIIMKAKSQAAIRGKQGPDGGGDVNMNSVVMGAGSNVKGDIYIIDQGKGGDTLVAGD